MELSVTVAEVTGEVALRRHAILSENLGSVLCSQERHEMRVSLSQCERLVGIYLVFLLLIL